MRKLEETFAEHIANMHLDFEDKAMKYEQIQHQIEANMRFMEQFYVDMQNKMNEKYALIKIERDAWEEEKDIIKNLVNLGGEVVSLNIGGNVHIQTEKSVLQSVP
jgi:cytochrome b involved in lipid metabolism